MPYGMRDVKDGSKRSTCVGQTALDEFCEVCLVLPGMTVEAAWPFLKDRKEW